MPKYQAPSFEVLVGVTATTTIVLGSACSSSPLTFSILDSDLTTAMTTAHPWITLNPTTKVVTADLTSTTPTI